MPTVIQIIRPADLGAEFAIVANKVRAGAATPAAAGVVRQATNAEVSSGTVVVAFTTPDQVASAIAGATPVAATTAVAGVSRLATNAEALAGVSNTLTVTPATATAIALQAAANAVSAGMANAFAAPNQATMLAANAKDNDICVRTDLGNQWFVCTALPSNNIANWYATPTAPTLTTKDEGTTLSAATTSIDFVGAGVTAASVGGATTVTVPAASAGATIDLQDLAGNHIAYAFP